ncbi:MAG TPA: tripartite tricarboxylate transporter substrate-binding protein [Alphaproteobacteria bacterium]|jgi:tripartite-type tricarboxylate transporter receptor subunit TctC
MWRERTSLLAFTGIAITTAFGLSPAIGQSVQDFYQKRQITLIVSTTASGGYDMYARTFARSFPRHVPGNPSIIVQNMPGAGGLTATNHLYERAAKDGTVIATIHSSMMTAPLLGIEHAKFDPRQLSMIGNITKEQQFCVSWGTAPIKSFDQVLAKQEFIVGAGGAGGNIASVPVLINNLFGANIKVISGYGGNAVLLAMERGEVHGRCAWSMPSLMTTHPEWLKEKKINFIVQHALEKHPDLPDVPLLIDYAKTDEQKGILDLVFAPQTIARPILGPPGIPSDRLQALRTGFQATMKDADFLTEAEKQGLDVMPSTAEDMSTLLARLYAIPDAIVQKAIEYSAK